MSSRVPDSDVSGVADEPLEVAGDGEVGGLQAVEANATGLEWMKPTPPEAHK